MYEVSRNGIVKVNRGDSFTMKATVDTGTPLNPITYIPNKKDVFYLGIMEPNQPFEFAIVRKKYCCDSFDEQGVLNMPFTPEDTECLIPGLYYYQIKARLYDEEKDEYKVNTIGKKQQFYILE